MMKSDVAQLIILKSHYIFIEIFAFYFPKDNIPATVTQAGRCVLLV